MRNYEFGLHRHMLRNALNVMWKQAKQKQIQRQRISNIFTVSKWDRQCIYFGFLILKSSSNSPALLYYYPTTLPQSRRHSWGIFLTVGWTPLFPVVICPCPMLSAMMSQVLTPHDHDFSSVLWPDNRSAPDRTCIWDAPRFFSYEIILNVNLFSERL